MCVTALGMYAILSPGFARGLCWLTINWGMWTSDVVIALIGLVSRQVRPI